MVLQDYTPQHMLATLRTRLLVMYAQVDIALEEAARSYEKGEAVRAIAVCDGDTAIDALENEIDELCLRLMARGKHEEKHQGGTDKHSRRFVDFFRGNQNECRDKNNRCRPEAEGGVGSVRRCKQRGECFKQILLHEK